MVRKSSIADVADMGIGIVHKESSCDQCFEPSWVSCGMLNANPQADNALLLPSVISKLWSASKIPKDIGRWFHLSCIP